MVRHGHRRDVQAATSLHAQLATVDSSWSDAQRWRMVGITPMIGQNDVAGEFFTLVDAQKVVDLAHAHGIGRLAMWSTARDRPCPGGPSPWVRNDCSGMDQEPWASSAVLST